MAQATTIKIIIIVGYASKGFMPISSKISYRIGQNRKIGAKQPTNAAISMEPTKSMAVNAHGRPIINFLVRKKRPIYALIRLV